MATTSFIAALMRRHATRAALVARPLSAGQGMLVQGVFLLSIPIAFVSPTAAMLSWLLVLAGRARRSWSLPPTTPMH